MGLGSRLGSGAYGLGEAGDEYLQRSRRVVMGHGSWVYVVSDEYLY